MVFSNFGNYKSIMWFHRSPWWPYVRSILKIKYSRSSILWCHGSKRRRCTLGNALRCTNSLHEFVVFNDRNIDYHINIILEWLLIKLVLFAYERFWNKPASILKSLFDIPTEPLLLILDTHTCTPAQLRCRCITANHLKHIWSVFHTKCAL